MQYLLVNPLSGHGAARMAAEAYLSGREADAKFVDLTEIYSMSDFLETLSPTDELVLFGGDGTLNRFVNVAPDAADRFPILYYPSGTGNDFCADVGRSAEDAPFPINEYLKNLPTVEVKGETYRFLNGVGYGIDGYCCEVGDRLRAEGKKANYTAIAIKGLLFHFQPRRATVTVDGVTHTYEKVWIAPTMFGSHYGGGMIPTPNQSRKTEPQKLSVMIFHGSSKLRTLSIFPSIFKGEHIKHTEFVEVLTGESITVRFDSPAPLQIDGETVLAVEEYTAQVASAQAKKSCTEAETAAV